MEAEKRETRVRLVSWNVQGRAMDDPAIIADRLDGIAADIVCFQEIHRSQFAAVRAASRLHHGDWWFKHWSIRYAAEGLAVASRWPVVAQPGSVALTHKWRWLHYTRRIAGGVTVGHPTGPLQVWNTHLSPDGAALQRRHEITELLGILPTEQTVLAGDLNVVPGSVELAMLADAGWLDGHDLAHPGASVMTNLTADRRHLKQRLDYVLVSRDLAASVVGAEVPGATEPTDRSWWVLSDHLPLVVDLDVSGLRDQPADIG